MGRGRIFLERLAVEAQRNTEIMPGQPIIEIAGNSRVLIENHSGVMGYSAERILIKVNYGCVSVCGCGLELLKMTREQLVIRGRINGVSLHGRDGR